MQQLPKKETAHTGGNRVSRQSNRTLARNDLMRSIVHEPLAYAIGKAPYVAPDFSDEARWAEVFVQDRMNAPRYEPGDVLHVDLSIHSFRGDALYAISVGGEQMIRYVQSRPGGLHIYPGSCHAAAYPVPRELLVFLGQVVGSTKTRWTA